MGISIDPGFTMRFSIPRLLSNEAVQVDVESMQSASQNGARSALFFRLIFKLLANRMLGFIQNLSMTVQMFILALQYPVHALDFFNGLFPLVTFDMIQSLEFWEQLFQYD